MYKQFSGLILVFTFFILIPLQGYAATPKETVETGVIKVSSLIQGILGKRIDLTH